MAKLQVEGIVQLLFRDVDDFTLFKSHLRDFLIQTKEFGAGNNEELFAEERAAAERARAQAVPGLLNPHAVKEEGMYA